MIRSAEPRFSPRLRHQRLPPTYITPGLPRDRRRRAKRQSPLGIRAREISRVAFPAYVGRRRRRAAWLELVLVDTGWRQPLA